MPAIYVHLSGCDLDNATLRQNGLTGQAAKALALANEADGAHRVPWTRRWLCSRS